MDSLICGMYYTHIIMFAVAGVFVAGMVILVVQCAIAKFVNRP